VISEQDCVIQVSYTGLVFFIVIFVFNYHLQDVPLPDRMNFKLILK